MKQKTNWFGKHRLQIALLAALLSSPAFAQSPCDAILEDADAVSGAVPKFENGQLVSVSMYGEGSFIAAKRSLITDARRQAELQAKSFLSNFFEEQIQRGTLHESLVESAELTSSDGITEAQAVELRRAAEYISSNSSAVLRGVVKLDECVDTNEKLILVRMGWKPSFAKTAEQASKANQSKKPNDVSDSNKPGIKYTEIQSYGSGASYEIAVRNALRSAVAQVFGEALASSQSVTNQVETLAISDSEDNSYGVAAERSSSTETTNSTTAGVIRKYRIIEVEETAQGFTSTVQVTLAEYNSGLDKSKQNIVVLPTLANREQSDIAQSIQHRLEQRLANSSKFNLLDREFVNAANTELGFIASGNSAVEELSRLGNQVGADLLVITEIVNYHVNKTERKVGKRTLERNELNAEVRLKIINPATTEVVTSEVININGLRVPKPSLTAYAEIITRQLSAKVMGTSSTDNQTEAKRSVLESKKRVEEKQKQLEKEYENDW